MALLLTAFAESTKYLETIKSNISDIIAARAAVIGEPLPDRRERHRSHSNSSQSENTESEDDEETAAVA